MDALWPIVVSGLLSSLLATGITLYVQQRTTRRQMKLDCLRRLAAFRTPQPTEKFIEALNEVFVTFNDAREVMSALSKFNRDVRDGRGHRNEHLIDLLKA